MRITMFPDRFATSKESYDTTWGDLVARCINPPIFPSKASCPLIKLATFGEQRTDKGCYRHDANVLSICGVEGDYDGEVMQPSAAAMLLETLGVEAVVYTSPGHTPERPRWRVLAPLATEHAPADRRDLLARINGALGGILAYESFTMSQTYYVGRVEGVEYGAHVSHGVCVDAATYLPPVYPVPTAPARTEPRIERTATAETIAELRSALTALSADEYFEWIAVGQALSDLGDDGFELWKEWSQTSQKYDSAVAEQRWGTFAGDRTGFASVFAKAARVGWDNPKRGVPQDLSKIFGAGRVPASNGVGLDLDAYAMNGMAAEMEKKMLEDKFIIGWLAILGQSTVFYAKPNAGKTLLLLWLLIESIKAGDIKADDVYFVNADDNHRGATGKLKLAEKHGFKMLVPGYKEFKPQILAAMLAKMVFDDTARGKILILDTVKKFTDIMDKKRTSEFGESVRQFVARGGSVIMLAHVNKHRDEDGQVIFSGTSDLVDDCDAAYTLDIVVEDKSSQMRTVKFVNFKNRGDNALEAVYQYSYGEKLIYTQRLDSVRGLGDAEKEMAEKRHTLEAMFDRNRDAVSAITDTIRAGITKKTDLIKAAQDSSSLSKGKIERALREHTGASIAEFEFWQVDIGDKNVHVYRLNPRF